MGPRAPGNGVRPATAPRAVLGSGVSLHASDIGVLVVYFVFVIGVGVWVSRPRGWSGASHLWLPVLGAGWAVGEHRAQVLRPLEILSDPSFID